MENLMAMMQRHAEVLQALTMQHQAASVAPTHIAIPPKNGSNSTVNSVGTTPRSPVVLDFGQATYRDKNGSNTYKFPDAEEEVQVK
ncbi:conserved hypothetical protein [Ricinus communis]|uniref:Uncharacterized protein n=1 Tax=Ricinus communis TaxID=3988 RepID=B9S856_RICCO|nr:conserved hypothetical protein [Ricinus communis]